MKVYSYLPTLLRSFVRDDSIVADEGMNFVDLLCSPLGPLKGRSARIYFYQLRWALPLQGTEGLSVPFPFLLFQPARGPFSSGDRGAAPAQTSPQQDSILPLLNAGFVYLHPFHY